MDFSNRTARRVAVALAGAGAMLAGCQREAEAPAPSKPAAPAPPVPKLPLPPPTLGRAELLEALASAAAGQAPLRPGETDALVGRRFAVRQAFGCPGSVLPQEGAEEGLAHWSLRPAQKSVELSLRPADWSRNPLMAGGDGRWEAVEGFWLTWPWRPSEDCPPFPAGGPQPAAAPSPQTAGLAAVFERGGSRVGRRDGRAFRFTIRSDAEPALPSPNGYRLVLEGRLAAFPDGRAIRCRSDGPDQRPVCVAAAEVDRVAFEDASGALLSEWTSGL